MENMTLDIGMKNGIGMGNMNKTIANNVYN